MPDDEITRRSFLDKALVATGAISFGFVPIPGMPKEGFHLVHVLSLAELVEEAAIDRQRSPMKHAGPKL